MGFLHPVALVIGGGLLALPIAVHLLTRPRPIRFPFSALRFLESVLRQRRFFSRLRDVLILALRGLLLVAVAGAFARPLLQGRVGAAAQDVAQRLVVLDVSRSMNARRGGVRVFDRARAEALRYLSRVADMRVNVIFAGAAPRAVFDTFSTNHLALQAEVRRAEVREEELDARGALAQAAHMLASAESPGKGQVVIVTDLQQTNWSKVSDIQFPADVDVIVEYVGLGPEVGNLAVADVAAKGRSEVGGVARAAVEVSNFSNADQVRTVQLTAAGRVYHQEVRCGAGQSAAAVFDIPADQPAGVADEGWVTGSAQILEARDALPSDDTRHFAFKLAEAPTFALIAREDPTQVGTSAYFLSRLLCPGFTRPGERGERVLWVEAGSLTSAALAEADMLVINGPGRLEDASLELLADLLLRGRPVFYVVSGVADVENLHRLEEICGGALKLPVRFSAWTEESGSAATAGGAPDGGFTLSHVQASLRPFSEFGDALERLTRGVTAARILKTTEDASGVPEDVLARWSDGSAAMVCTDVGNGRLVIWNCDLLRSSLPRSPFFIVLVRELTLMLLADRFGVESALPVGAARVLAVPPGAESTQGLSLIGPDGVAIEQLELQEGATGATWRWAEVGPPGVYRVVRGESTLLAVATACPAAESDLRPMPAAEVAKGLALGSEVPGRKPTVTVLGLEGGAERSETYEVWPWLVVAALVVILLELGTLKFFRV